MLWTPIDQCAHAHTHARARTHTHARTHAHTHTPHTTHTHTHARSHTHTHVHTHTHHPAPRLRAGKEGKQMGVPMEPAAFIAHVQGLLAEVQAALLAQATAFRDANIVDVTSYDELKAAVAEGG